MSFAILGLGTSLPPYRYTQEDFTRAAQGMTCQDQEQAQLLQTLFRQTNIAHRHMVISPEVYQDLVDRTNHSGTGYAIQNPGEPGPSTRVRMEVYEREALPLARQSSLEALRHAEISPSAITHLVTVSCTGFHAPGFDVGLIRSLGLSSSVERTHVGFMGCHGALNGLRVARAFAGADPHAVILLCAVEICSIHYHYPWNPKRMVGNALFADGSAALVGRAGDAASAWRVEGQGSALFPDSAEAMTWSIGDHGFDMTLSTKVPNLIARHLRPWLESWLETQGVKLSEIASWAIHPGGPRVVASVEEALGLPQGSAWASREVLTEYGNMSSATILFILDRLRRNAAPRPCVGLGFGPGLAAEAVLFR